MYYLNSRYYVPELGRFISPDAVEYLSPNNINGLNLYCYCMNNPTNKYDSSGHFVITLTTLLIGGLIAGETEAAYDLTFYLIGKLISAF